MVKIVTANDAQALSFVQAQAYRINTVVLAAKYPNWNFDDLIYVETEGNPWAMGVVTYSSDESGKAQFISGAAKDMPIADVSQDMQLKSFHLGGIGYQYNLEEINTALNVVGGTLPSRRASAAYNVYRKFMWDTTLFGHAEKGLKGLTNYTGVPVINAEADGTGSVPHAVGPTGVALKTPQKIVRDLNRALAGVSSATYGIMLANHIMLPEVLLNHMAATPMSDNTTETILSFFMRTNSYTTQTGQPLRIRALRELNTAAADGSGRVVAYNDSPDLVKLHLPMRHQFLAAHPDGWANTVIPGIFRTGGVEFLAPQTAVYLDRVTAAPSA